MIFSFFLQTADTILKETIFSGAAERLKGRSVDLFVVNSFGSAYQAIFIGLLLPFLSKLWGIPFYQLPSYIKDGAACFLNINGLSTGCDGAPLLSVLFVIVNMCYNSLLYLLKISSALVTCLASTISVPLSVFVFTLHLPYLGPGTALPPVFVKLTGNHSDVDIEANVGRKLSAYSCAYTALIHGFLNAGNVTEARRVFLRMRLKGPFPDFRAYTVLIAGLCEVGKAEDALRVLSEMRDDGLIPGSVNFRTVFFGLNREGKRDLAQTVMQQKRATASKRKLLHG